ncbi:uncharacterized protein TNCV_841691 [Trichonephila clavipes]|nr:uncharacterized protein TNCV_841691 [Trichonephila clavipes]
MSAKFVPRLLTEDQQFQRLVTSSDLFQSESDDLEFMKLIITGDESRVYGYDPTTKQQSSHWKTPVLLVGIVHQENTPQGQTVNKEFYLDVMRRLREAVHRTRPVLWPSSRWMLHHAGAPAHIKSCAAVPGKTRNNPSSTSSLPAGYVTSRFFPSIPRSRTPLKRTPVSGH